MSAGCRIYVLYANDKKNNTTQKVRTTSKDIIREIEKYGKKSIRKLAHIINLSKSSIHRHLQAKERRDQHPESSLWETEVGNDWMRLLVFATIYHFGFECGVGSNKLSNFFTLIRIDTHVGVSSSTVLGQLKKMEQLLPEFQAACEKRIKHKPRQAVVAMDETFFGDFLILVLMDLRSGYLLLEDITDDRSFDTWFAKTSPRLESLGIEVNQAVSDRAKALIKLAVIGFDCKSGADLFHAQQDASRWLGATLARRTTSAEKKVTAAKIVDETENENNESTEKKQEVKELKQCFEALKQSKAEYHDSLQGMSDDLHPFSLEDNSAHTACKIEDKLEKRVQSFEKIAQEQAIEDRKGTAQKLRNQIAPLAVNVSAWWFWINENLQALTIDTLLQEWLINSLLPVVYWHYQYHKTQNSQSKEKYQMAWENASIRLKEDPFSCLLSTSEWQHWQMWSEWAVQQFHRSSSAVEGRNGCLSQMYHNGRGLSQSRLKALTVIHNYGLKRKDGTTAAERLFEIEFPDLFSWLLDEMGELPLPRKGRQRIIHNPLELLGVPL